MHIEYGANTMNFTLDIIIPTYRPDQTFTEVISRLLKQTYPINQILILDTESGTFPASIPSMDPRIQVQSIPISEFDHGGTRHYGASLSKADLILFMTQDAMPLNHKLIEHLIQPFTQDDVVVSYARQIANSNSNILEKFTREFNYPNQSSVKSLDDLPTLGIKTYFCSNVCAVYKRERYMALGGFVRHTIFNEDMIMAANIVKAGYNIAYQADAVVTHSHKYSLLQNLRRNFDLAVSQYNHPEVFQQVKSTDEGFLYVKKVIQHLCESRNFHWIPYFVCESTMKYIGYKLGMKYKTLPMWLVRSLSMNVEYWNESY